MFTVIALPERESEYLLGRNVCSASSGELLDVLPGGLDIRGILTVADCVFLLAIVFCTAALLYACAHLGFYSDDWANLETFRNCPDQSTLGFFACVKENYRLVQSFQSATLYRFFGSNPVGYHVVNSIVFAFLILFIYAVLRGLSQPRVISLTVPLIYSLLPHYSTDRFWIASFQANLCMVLYFAGVFALSRAQARLKRGWRPFWAAFSAIALVLSSLAYEVAIPLFVLVPLLILRKNEAEWAEIRAPWLLSYYR